MGRPNALAALLLVLAINAPALLLLARTGGPLYHVNGDGEPIYLQFDMSRATQSLFSRTGQYPVTALHHAGLSGGWINLAWDVVMPLLFLVLVRAIGRSLGLGPAQAGVFALAAALGPALVLASNPLVQALADWGPAVRWLALPAATGLPMVRTPEPQFSLVLLAAATWLGLRYRSFLPVFGCLPFLYPFVAVPAAFVALGLRLRGPWAPLASWVAVSAACAAVIAGTAGPEARLVMAPTREPVVSLTTLVGLALWAAVRGQLREDLRRPALLLALAPLAAENVQVVTGWLAQPANVELYAGTVCVALILGLAVADRPRQAWAACGAAAVLYAATLVPQVRWAAGSPIPDARMLEALRADPGRVAVSDRLVRHLNLVHPRQAATALDPFQTWRFYVPLGSLAPDDRFERYLDARNEIRRDPRRAEEFRALLDFLDAGYAHRHEDFVLYHLGRKESFAVNVDVEAEAARRPPRPDRLLYGSVTPEGFLTVGRD